MMGEKEIFEFLRSCDSELDSHGMHLFFSVDSGLQKKSVSDLEKMTEKVNSVLEISQGQNFETLSNWLMGFICYVRSIQYELRAYLHMKSRDMSEAWGVLVDAREALRSAKVADPTNLGEICDTRITRLDKMEELFFPPQSFVSIGAIAKSAKCSICNADYRNCDHIAERIYNGRFCNKVFSKWTLTEVSSVKDPVDRNARVISFLEGNKHYDKLTLREVTVENNKTDKNSGL